MGTHFEVPVVLGSDTPEFVSWLWCRFEVDTPFMRRLWFREFTPGVCQLSVVPSWHLQALTYACACSSRAHRQRDASLLASAIAHSVQAHTPPRPAVAVLERTRQHAGEARHRHTALRCQAAGRPARQPVGEAAAGAAERCVCAESKLPPLPAAAA